MPLIRAGNDHKLLHQVMLVFLAQIVALVVQIFDSSIDNFYTALHDQFSGINTSLSLLDEEETLGYFWMIRHLHNLHLLNLDAAHLNSILKKAGHVVSDQSRVAHEARLIVGRFVIESAASGSEYFQALILEVELVVVHSISGHDWINDFEVDDHGDVHWRTLEIWNG